MKHLGDITKISGFTAPVVDCIIGGSPCQDLSVAGKRAGLAGERSGLFMDQIRVVKEMRENEIRSGRSNDAIRPRFMVWENVQGALSSNKGEDFRAVLEETARVAKPDAVIPEFPRGGGTQPDVSWETDGVSLGEYMMPNIGELRNGEDAYVCWLISTENPQEKFYLNCSEKPIAIIQSKLSRILESNPNPKYNLSAKACMGILSRAKRRGKKLPEQLETVLRNQCAMESQVLNQTQ